MNYGKFKIGIGILLGVLSARATFACAVCSVTSEASRWAYYGTTAFLTFLPLFMIGGVVYYIAKKGR